MVGVSHLASDLHPAAGLHVIETADGDLRLGNLIFETHAVIVRTGLPGPPVTIPYEEIYEITPAESHADVQVVRSAGEVFQPGQGGIFIPKWSNLTIPAGALRIRLGPNGPEMDPVIAHVALEQWPHWADIALRQWRQAELEQRRLLSARDEEDGRGVHEALHGQYQHAMLAVSAAAFALDALYDSLRPRVGIPQATLDAWTKRRTARAKRVAEVHRRATQMAAPDARSLRDRMVQVFKLRDQAVHPSHAPTPAVLHPDLGVGVAEVFLRYDAANALAACNVALEAVHRLRQSTLKGDDQRWASSQVTILDDLLDDHRLHLRE